jgi:hypothetical protein
LAFHGSIGALNEAFKAKRSRKGEEKLSGWLAKRVFEACSLPVCSVDHMQQSGLSQEWAHMKKPPEKASTYFPGKAILGGRRTSSEEETDSKG